LSCVVFHALDLAWRAKTWPVFTRKDFGVGWIRVIPTPSQTVPSVEPATCVIRLPSSGGPHDLEGLSPHPPADFHLLWIFSFLGGAYREFFLPLLLLLLYAGGHVNHYFPIATAPRRRESFFFVLIFKSASPGYIYIYIYIYTHRLVIWRAVKTYSPCHGSEYS
jgi:hypothetical protein